MVVQAVARDQDELNQPVRYSLSGSGSEYFSIDGSTGMVTVSDTSGIIRGRQYLLEIKVNSFTALHLHQVNVVCCCIILPLTAVSTL